MTPKIILLNGVGSAGKSSIARAIQSLAAESFLHVEMDDFLCMMPSARLGRPDGLVFERIERNGEFETVVRSGPAVERTMRGMRLAIAAMAAAGCNMVIDDVMIEDRSAEYRSLLAPYDLRIVGVHAPLDVLEAREKARGDRAIGLARAQFGIVHHGVAYDLEIDTGTATPEECARRIVAAFGL